MNQPGNRAQVRSLNDLNFGLSGNPSGHGTMLPEPIAMKAGSMSDHQFQPSVAG